MIVENHITKGEEILSYVIASGDMRCIDIAERVLFVRHDPGLGLVIRGELPDCVPGSYVDLSYILLEYVMSCDDRREAELTAKAADNFGQLLGQKIIDLCDLESSGKTTIEALSTAVIIVLNSMNVPFETDQSNNLLRFRLVHCPLHAVASKSGLSLWLALAHRSLVTLIETLLHGLAPEWRLVSPAERESDEPLQEILFTRN